MSKSTKSIATHLNTLLADTYALLGQTQHAHWNVEGPDFFQLHLAFEAQYGELFEAVDELAERVRALGFYAEGGLATFAKASKITELPTEKRAGKDYVAHLIESHEITVATAVKTRDAAEESGDQETHDLVIKRIQEHQKTLWMLRSYAKNS